MACAAHYKGAMAEQFVIMKMLERGYDVFTPVMTQSSCDLIIIRNGKPLKVQVKFLTTITSSGKKYEQARLQGRVNNTGFCRDYEQTEFDYLTLTNLKDVFMIPWELVCHHKSITLGGSGAKRNFDVLKYKLNKAKE